MEMQCYFYETRENLLICVTVHTFSAHRKIQGMTFLVFHDKIEDVKYFAAENEKTEAHRKEMIIYETG